jgi:hypothetical protein
VQYGHLAHVVSNAEDTLGHVIKPRQKACTVPQMLLYSRQHPIYNSVICSMVIFSSGRLYPGRLFAVVACCASSGSLFILGHNAGRFTECLWPRSHPPQSTNYSQFLQEPLYQQCVSLQLVMCFPIPERIFSNNGHSLDTVHDPELRLRGLFVSLLFESSIAFASLQA